MCGGGALAVVVLGSGRPCSPPQEKTKKAKAKAATTRPERPFRILVALKSPLALEKVNQKSIPVNNKNRPQKQKKLLHVKNENKRKNQFLITTSFHSVRLLLAPLSSHNQHHFHHHFGLNISLIASVASVEQRLWPTEPRHWWCRACVWTESKNQFISCSSVSPNQTRQRQTQNQTHQPTHDVEEELEVVGRHIQGALSSLCGDVIMMVVVVVV